MHLLSYISTFNAETNYLCLNLNTNNRDGESNHMCVRACRRDAFCKLCDSEPLLKNCIYLPLVIVVASTLPR